MRILGRALLVERVTAEVSEYLAAQWFFPDTADALQSSFGIRLRCADAAVPADVLTAESWSGHWGTQHVKVGPNELWIAEGGSAVHVDITRAGASIALHGAPFQGWTALHVGISEALTADGLVRLHASAATNGDRTVVFTGPSGRGKSTTLLRALEQGWAAIAEDGCVVEPLSHRLFGFDRSLRLLPDAAASLGGVTPAAADAGGSRAKIEIAFSDLPAHASQARLTDIVHLERRPEGPTSWNRLPMAQSVGALFEASGLPSSDLGRDSVSAAFARLAQEVCGWRLVLGDTPPVLADLPRPSR